MSIELFADLGKPDGELHPQFLSLRDAPGYAPARQLIKQLQAEFSDPDGNFVEQFQTFGLDARTFEFFLSVMLKDAGHELDRSFDRPDFLITKDGLTAAVEAVTANPPGNGTIQPYEAVPDFKTLQQATESLELSTNLQSRVIVPLAAYRSVAGTCSCCSMACPHRA